MVEAERKLVVTGTLVESEAVLAVTTLGDLSRVGENRIFQSTSLIRDIVGGDFEVNDLDGGAGLVRGLANGEVVHPDIFPGNGGRSGEQRARSD